MTIGSTPEQRLAALRLHCPPGQRVPELVQDFYAWAETHGEALGYYGLFAGRLDDFYVEDGSRSASSFFSVLRCADGSQLALWRPNEEALTEAPVVLLDSEGELRAVGASFSDFLLRWAADATDVPDLTNEDEPDAGAQARAALAGWLQSRAASSTGPGSALGETTTALEAWFSAWSAQRNKLAAADAERKLLADCVNEVVGLPKEIWERNFVDAVVTDSQCQIFGTYVGQKPLTLSPDFESALRRFRDHDVQELPEAGLWFRASLELDRDGVLTVKRSYMDQPNPSEIQLDPVGLRADAKRMPRSAYWTPPWLAQLIAQS